MPAKNRRTAAAQVGQINGTIKDMQGKLRLRAVVIDGQTALLTELPNGISFGLGREEMLAYCFTSLAMLRSMFASPEELDAAVIAAQQRVAPTPKGPLQ